MCILLKLDYTKFRVPDLLFSNVIEEKRLGGRGGGGGRLDTRFESQTVTLIQNKSKVYRFGVYIVKRTFVINSTKKRFLTRSL